MLSQKLLKISTFLIHGTEEEISKETWKKFAYKYLSLSDPPSKIVYMKALEKFKEKYDDKKAQDKAFYIWLAAFVLDWGIIFAPFAGTAIIRALLNLDLSKKSSNLLNEHILEKSILESLESENNPEKAFINVIDRYKNHRDFKKVLKEKLYEVFKEDKEFREALDFIKSQQNYQIKAAKRRP